MRQKSILLRFIETMHLIYKENGPPILRLRSLRLDNGLVDILDPAQYGRDGNKLRIKSICHHASQGGFTHSWGAPENHGMRTSRLKGNTQGLANTHQLLLTNQIIQASGTQPLGQGSKMVRARIE